MKNYQKIEAKNHRLAKALIATLILKYSQVENKISQILSLWYAEPNKLLTKTELRDFPGRKRLSRRAAINLIIKREIKNLEDIVSSSVENLGSRAIHNAFNSTFNQSILYQRWHPDSTNFEEIIGRNFAKLEYNLKKILIQNSLTGENLTNVKRSIHTLFRTELRSLSRLIQTETTFFTSEGIKLYLLEKGETEYQLIATIDERTSEICRSLDGQIFKLSDYEVGVTAPPFHPNCRTVISEVI